MGWRMGTPTLHKSSHHPSVITTCMQSIQSLTQQGQGRPSIGHSDLCKRSPASSWFCALVPVLAAAHRENVASRPLAYPGGQRGT